MKPIPNPPPDPTIITGPPFSQFGVSKGVIAELAARGITSTFAIQALVLNDAIAGRDVLGKSRTGSGKTLAFAVPMVERLSADDGPPTGLVLVPTRELAMQVAADFGSIAPAKGLRIALAYGGTSVKEQGAQAKHCDVLVATPGRLIDLQNRRAVELDKIKIVVLDEADRMLDMGFLPDVNQILKMLPVERQTMLFSATLDGQIGVLARRYTQEAVTHEIIDARPVVENAEHRFLMVAPIDKVPTLIAQLKEERGLTLVFTRTKRACDELARNLIAKGYKAQALHGDMQQKARETALKKFEDGVFDILVATDVAARGLDLNGITHVVNYDPPDDEKSYVHRVGRTARAGAFGVGITLVTPDQRGEVSRWAQRLKLNAEILDAGMKIHAPRTVFSSKRGGMRGKRRR